MKGKTMLVTKLTASQVARLRAKARAHAVLARVVDWLKDDRDKYARKVLGGAHVAVDTDGRKVIWLTQVPEATTTRRAYTRLDVFRADKAEAALREAFAKDLYANYRHKG